jgi:hypothetical protein
MTMQNQITKANIQSFIRQARILSDNKINFNRAFLKKFSVQEECFSVARVHLGTDMAYLEDAFGVRSYIREVFGTEGLRLFEDDNGGIILDLEHALLFYYSLLANSSPFIETALGLVYLIAGHQLDDEFTHISKVAPKGRITPKFDLDAKLFRWKSCPFILRKYMLQLSQVEGYTAYYFEKSFFNQTAYLVSTGMSFDEADAQMNSMKGGLFYPLLPPRIENVLVPSILKGDFDTSGMQGNMTQRYIKENSLLATSYEISAVYNVYNQTVKPIEIEIIGLIIKNMLEDVNKNAVLAPSDLSIYHLSPQRVGILVKDGLHIQKIMPTMSKFFKPVEQFDLRNILNGDFL